MTFSKFEQFLKARLPTCSIFSGKVILVKLVQSEKASLDIVLIFLGNSMFFKFVQPLKALKGISVIFSERVIVSNCIQLRKTDWPIPARF